MKLKSTRGYDGIELGKIMMPSVGLLIWMLESMLGVSVTVVCVGFTVYGVGMGPVSVLKIFYET